MEGELDVAEESVRIAVAGAGAFGREHLRVLSGMSGVSIVGVADVNSGAAQAAAERFGAGTAAIDAVEMIERLRPDGFIVATPGQTHVALTSAALRLGIPVLLEKPVGLSRRDADVLIEAEGKSRGFVLPGHILRFSAPYRALVDIARSADVGPILSVSARNHRDDSHAVRYPDIDPVLMTMVHAIDLAIWTTGAELASVLAFRRPEGTARSETLITGTDTRGSVWHISNAWTFPTSATPPDRVEIVGERGSVEMELGAHIRVFGSRPREIDLRKEPEDDMLLTEVSSFVACVKSGRKPDVVTLKDARSGLAAVDAILESLRSGKVARA